MRQIEIVGMRKNRDVKIVITIIILAIISIIVCTGIILYNRYNRAESVETVAGLEDPSNQNSAMVGSDEDGKKENVDELEDDSESEQEEGIGENKNDEKAQEFIDKINNIYNGEEGKRVFLTFDDGPTQEVTQYILDILDKYNIKATFFVLGNRVEMNPDLLKREYESGHYIANHGYSHKYSKIYKSATSVLSEYNKTEKAIQEALGNPNYSSNLFRFPGGSHVGPYEKIKKKARTTLNENGIAYLEDRKSTRLNSSHL